MKRRMNFYDSMKTPRGIHAQNHIRVLAMEGFDQPLIYVVETTLEIQMPNKRQKFYVDPFK
jgi:hypothetical protein